MMKKALVVDNDYFFVEFLGGLLEQRGYQVLKAANGKEGIARLEGGPVDILFADLVLPKVDGRQFFRFIRQKFNGACFPLIALSGTMIEQLGNLDQIGADYFIAKGPTDSLSIQLNDFLTQIESHPLPVNGHPKVLAAGNVFPRRDAVELLNSLKFQQAILAGMGVGVMVVDLDARIIDVNALALKITARSSVHLLNHTVVDIFPPKYRSTLAQTLKQVIRDPEIQTCKFPVVCDQRLVEIRVSAIQLDGNAAGWVVLLVP